LYYLHVKRLLETRTDGAIGDQDYVAIVEIIEKDFKVATDHNIRMSTFADLKANFSFRKKDYSRSDRISELYNDLIYQGVLPDAPNPANPAQQPGVSNPVQMRELKIFPLTAPGAWDTSFSPRAGNAGRQAKVPMLIINSTSLNTARAWQFTAQSMGEPIAHTAKGTPIYEETDSKPLRLRWARPSYDNISPRQQKFSLGHAVGASACVPVLFPPLSISDLYTDIRVQLVDGGVFDNQGIESLQYEECTHYVVSDASGQIGIENEPQTGSFPVLTRTSNDIYPDRVRTESLQKLFAARGRGNIAFMHLRKGLGVAEIPWNDANNLPAGPINNIPPNTAVYGVAAEVQDCLSKIRTDLDAFSEVEAFTLMLDGYRMSNPELAALAASSFPAGAAGPLPGPWGFNAIAPWINAPTPDYLKQLKVSNYLFGKALFLIPWLAALAAAAVLLLLIALWPWLWTLFTSNIQISIPGSAVAIILLMVLVGKFAPRLEKIFDFFKFLRAPLGTLRRLLFSVAPAVLIGTGIVQLYLKLINPLYLKRGSIAELERRKPGS
ncbi:MAG: hypothetical protein ACREDX_10705, partial [Aestuariivirga sp.]